MDDGDFEYEFPCFNFMEAPSDVWDPISEGNNGVDPVYSGVLLQIADPKGHSSQRVFGVMFPRVQSFLRRHANRKSVEEEETNEDSSYDLLQWRGGSKVSAYCGSTGALMEAIVTLKEEEDAVEVKVRGASADAAKRCFFFLEEILGVIDQVWQVPC